MKKSVLLLIACTALAATAYSRLPAGEASRIADAIYIVEGGARAKVPYGILSIKVRGAKHARTICLNTIQNNHDRWLAAGKPGDYYDFLGDRYCPPSVDPEGNANWKRNLKRILK